MKPLKIQSIRTYRIQLHGDTWLWVELTTDNGLTGWGEASSSGNDQAVAEIIAGWEPLLLGKDPRRIIDLSAPVNVRTFKRDRLSMTGWSGIDQALWDVAARSFGLPLYHLLGAFGNDSIPLYANLNRAIRKDRQPGALAEQGKSALDNGFTIVKCAPFDEISPDLFKTDIAKPIERLEALAAHVPWTSIAIDCHERFSRTSLADFMAYLKSRNVVPYWIEDVLPSEDADLFKHFRNSYPYYRWAEGETSINIADLWNELNERNTDVIMPDVKHIGGVSAIRSLIPVAEDRGLWVSLHSPTGPISTAFSAHLSALRRKSIPMEYPWGVAQERSQSTFPPEPVSGGKYHLSADNPGIGLQPNPEFLLHYGTIWEAGQWK
jgi:galactonate dehydratase